MMNPLRAVLPILGTLAVSVSAESPSLREWVLPPAQIQGGSQPTPFTTAGRRIYRSEGRTIASQIREGDTAIEVLSGDDPPLTVTLPGSHLERVVKAVEVAAVVRVSEVLGRLTPDGSWIVSTITANVEDLLNERGEGKGRWVEGKPFVFELGGGTVEIGDVRVTATVQWTRPLEVGRTYLIFGRLVRGQLRVHELNVYEATPSGFASQTRDKHADDIEGKSLAEIKKQLQSIRISK